MSWVSPGVVANWCYGAGFRGSDLTTIVAIGMAGNGGIPDLAKPGGIWGVGEGDGPTQAAAAKAVWDKAGKDGFTYGKNNAYLLFAAPAAAAAATVTVADVAVPDALVDTADLAKTSAETSLRLLRSLDDPIFWRGAIFIGIGMTVISISGFVLLYRGVFRPAGNRVTRAIGISDVKYDRLSQFHGNVTGPLWKWMTQ